MAKVFGHYIPRNLLVLAFAEFVALILAFLAGVETRFANDSITEEFLKLYEFKAFVFATSYFVCMVAVGLYSRSLRETFGQTIIKLIASSLLAFVLLVVVYYVLPQMFVGRGAFLLSLSYSITLLFFIRYFYSFIQDSKLLNKRLLVIGTEDSATQLQMLKRKSDWQGITLVGYFHLKGDQDKVGEEKSIRTETALSKVVKDYGIDEIVVAVEEHRKNYPVDEIIKCKMQGVEVTEVSRFFEIRTGRIQLDVTHPNRFIFIEGFSQNYLRVFVKRLLDIVVSLLMIVLTLPLYPVLIFLIKKESGWREPVFYNQIRVGQGEEDFVIWKFRSMVVGAEQKGAQWAAKNDTRVTKVGAVMRKTRMDELPQLWNVLRGDMSFVGPRPERPEFVEKLAQQIPYFRMRHRVKPGITGWAQVCYPYGDTVQDAKEKLQYDLYYIKNYSVFLDLTILAQTAQVILWQKGAR